MQHMYILSIDTSCDETAVAITEGRKVIAELRYSQVLMHKEWGGVVPSVAKRAHQERIDWVINETVKKATRVTNIKSINDIDYVAVTQGPGLAIALEVGIAKAKELVTHYKKPLIGVNHMEGHIYSAFVQNSKGNPVRDFQFPYLALLISGGHTEIVLFKDHLQYQILGSTRDDAVGEALDKAARMLGFQYPGGPVIERLAEEVQNEDKYHFPRPMKRSNNLDFSFSGLKTAFLYSIRNMNDKDKIDNIRYLSSSFQEAAFEVLESKVENAMKQTGIYRLVVGGGVAANRYLRLKFKKLASKHNSTVLFPPYKYLTGDNAAMIGVVAYYKVQQGIVSDPQSFDRVPRLELSEKA